MRKLIPTAFGLAAMLLAFGASAQQDVPGEARALPAKRTTLEERKEARQQRLATSKEMVRKDEGRLDDVPKSAAPATRVPKDERLAARQRRKAEGTQAAHSDAGRVPEAANVK